MVESLRLPSTVASASLAVFSVSQAIARVAAGAISESALTWKTDRFGIDGGVPRPVFLIVASVVGICGQGILAYATTLGPFVVGIALSGVAFGGIWPLMVLCVGEVFGTAHHGANYLIFDGLSSAFGTLLVSKYLVQRVYESHIDLSDPEADGITCYGSACFRLSHLATSLLCLSGVGTSLGFLHTTREAYQRHASEHGSNI
jgi:MFS family permease